MIGLIVRLLAMRNHPSICRYFHENGHFARDCKKSQRGKGVDSTIGQEEQWKTKRKCRNKVKVVATKTQSTQGRNVALMSENPFEVL